MDINEKNENYNLNIYSLKIEKCYVEYEYFQERNERLEKIVKRVIQRTKPLASVPDLFLFIFNRKRQTLINLSNIVFDSIENNKNNMLKLYSVFMKVFENLDGIRSGEDEEYNKRKKELLNEYLEFKKLLDNQINTSYKLSNELQENFTLLERNKQNRSKLGKLREVKSE